MLDIEHHLNRTTRTKSGKESNNKSEYQIATIDEFSVARINRLWNNWLHTNPTNSRSKHEFYRSEICSTPGLQSIRLATVYVLLARLDAKYRKGDRQQAQEISTHLPGADANADAKAGPA